MNIPFEPLRRWSKDPIKINWKIKIKMKTNWKTKNENRIFLKNSKTRRYTILYEKTIRVWINIPFEPVRRWSKDPNKIKMKNQNEKSKWK